MPTQKGRAAFAAGRAEVAASQPLTARAYRDGVGHYSDGAGDLALAATLMKTVKLPPDCTAASAAAPRCRT